jgi:hypothetical protein
MTNVATASAGPGCEAQSNPVIVRVPGQPPTLPCPVEKCDDFNDKPIAAGNYVWFSSVVEVHKRDRRPGTVNLTNQRIKFSANAVNYDLPAPDAMIIFSATATQADTVFDAVSNRWVTTVPVKYNGKVFIGGLAVPAPAGGFPKKLKPVCWSGGFGSDIGKLELRKWAAAVYQQFSTDYTTLGSNRDSDKLNPYVNNDRQHAGELQEPWSPGASGGGHNYTGTYTDPIRLPAARKRPSGMHIWHCGLPGSYWGRMWPTTDTEVADQSRLNHRGDVSPAGRPRQRHGAFVAGGKRPEPAVDHRRYQAQPDQTGNEDRGVLQQRVDGDFPHQLFLQPE